MDFTPSSLSNLEITSTSISSMSFSTSQDQAMGRVFSTENTPLGLKQLNRSPREILENKSKMCRTDVKITENMRPGKDDEEMTELRSFYMGVIRSIHGQGKVENKGSGTQPLGKKLKTMENELEVLRNKAYIVEMTKNKLKETLKAVWREKEYLELVREEEERQHLDVLISVQKKIKNCLTELSCLASLSSFPPAIVPEAALYSKVFPNPSPPTLHPLPPTTGGLLHFSNLFCLSGQLLQFCQGQYGSKLVLDRLREGTEPERDLVREELGLPSSLGLILEAGNVHCMQVLLVLVETDLRTRVEVVEQVKRNFEEFSKIEGGEESFKKLMSIIRKK